MNQLYVYIYPLFVTTEHLVEFPVLYGRFSLVIYFIKSACKCRRCGFDCQVGKIPWRRKRRLTPVFLPGKSHRQRSPAGYSPWGLKELDTTEWLTLSLLLNFCTPPEQSPMTGVKRYNRDSKVFEWVNEIMRAWNFILLQENLQLDQALPFSKNQVNRNHDLSFCRHWYKKSIMQSSLDFHHL